MHSSLRTKLILSHLVVIFVAIAALVILLLTLIRGYFLDALEESLVAQAHLLTSALVPGASAAEVDPTLSPAMNTVQQQQLGNLSVQVENTDAENSQETPLELSASNLTSLSQLSVQLNSVLETRFLVLDHDGVVLVDSSGSQGGMDLSGTQAVAAALNGAQGVHSELISGEGWRFVTLPMQRDDQVIGAIQLGQPLRDILAVLSDLRTRMLLVLAFTLPGSALIGWLLARQIARPVLQLTHAAGKLSQGEYDYPLETSSNDEIGLLTDTFSGMRDRLQAEEQTRTRFVSDVSHELRTPLTAIKGLAETLRAGAVDDPQVRGRFLDSMEEETDRLIRLVNDLLILTRADSHALPLQQQSVDLRQLVSKTVDRLVAKAGAKELQIVLDFPEGNFDAVADPDRIEQVVVNLLDNAMKASPSGETIRITGHVIANQDLAESTGTMSPDGPLSPESWILLSVTDHGVGIDPADLPRIFDRFYRADRSRSREGGGSGLGLSIAKAIIDAHHGSIWLESPPAPESSGTRANVLLPQA